MIPACRFLLPKLIVIQQLRFSHSTPFFGFIWVVVSSNWVVASARLLIGREKSQAHHTRETTCHIPIGSIYGGLIDKWAITPGYENLAHILVDSSALMEARRGVVD